MTQIRFWTFLESLTRVCGRFSTPIIVPVLVCNWFLCFIKAHITGPSLYPIQVLQRAVSSFQCILRSVTSYIHMPCTPRVSLFVELKGNERSRFDWPGVVCVSLPQLRKHPLLLEQKMAKYQKESKLHPSAELNCIFAGHKNRALNCPQVWMWVWIVVCDVRLIGKQSRAQGHP